MEDELGLLADLIIIVVESPGACAELGAFSLNPSLRPKLLPILDKHYESDQSFINSGPIRWINKDSRYGKAIFTDFNTILLDAGELDQRLEKIPRRGRLKMIEEVQDLHEKPKHLLFLLCDLLAVIGPATRAHCEYYLDHILDSSPRWSVANLIGLGVALGLISEVYQPDFGYLYYRPLLNGQLESFQHQKMFELPQERARFLSIYQTIRPLRTLVLT